MEQLNIQEANELFNIADFRKSFLVQVDGRTWQWFIPLADGRLIQFPAGPNIIVQVYSERETMHTLEKFKKDLDTQLENIKKGVNVTKEIITSIADSNSNLKNISIKPTDVNT